MGGGILGCCRLVRYFEGFFGWSDSFVFLILRYASQIIIRVQSLSSLMRKVRVVLINLSDSFEMVCI